MNTSDASEFYVPPHGPIQDFHGDEPRIDFGVVNELAHVIGQHGFEAGAFGAPLVAGQGGGETPIEEEGLDSDPWDEYFGAMAPPLEEPQVEAAALGAPLLPATGETLGKGKHRDEDFGSKGSGKNHSGHKGKGCK
jgi:hypothetical protein